MVSVLPYWHGMVKGARNVRQKGCFFVAKVGTFLRPNFTKDKITFHVVEI